MVDMLGPLGNGFSLDSGKKDIVMVAGGIAVIFLVWGAISYIASRGNEEATEAAKKTMTAALVGLIVVIMAFAMVFIISQILVTGAPGTGIGP